MTIIYAVASGSYSEYSVHALFSTQEKAQAFIDAVGADDADIEERELDPVDAPLAHKLYFGRIRRETGEVFDVDRRESFYGATNTDFGTDVNDDFHTYVFARDVGHAVKAIADRYREAKALNRLPQPREKR